MALEPHRVGDHDPEECDVCQQIGLIHARSRAPTPGPDARAPEEAREVYRILGALTNAAGVLLNLPIGNRYEEEALARLKREWTRADAFLCAAPAPPYEGLRRAAEAIVNAWFGDDGSGDAAVADHHFDALRAALAASPSPQTHDEGGEP